MRNNSKDGSCVVLGRFQPVHKGHAFLISEANVWRLKNQKESKLVIAVGSTNKPQNLLNPWTFEERKVMLEASISELEIDAEIIGIPDIDDPPNWVKHANKFHGENGVLFTSDGPTGDIYSDAGWDVIVIRPKNRDKLVGWRVRETMRMMSTIQDTDAVKSVLGESIQKSVIMSLIETGALRRLAFMGEGGEPVG